MKIETLVTALVKGYIDLVGTAMVSNEPCNRVFRRYRLTRRLLPIIRKRLAANRAELAALRELTRWHKWPDERPPKVSTYIMQTVFRDVYLDVWEDDQWVGTQDAQALQWAYLPGPNVKEETTR